MSLQQKFHKLQEENNIKGSIDCLRLLKDTLSLIKEYDWHLEYSEYEVDGRKQVSVWEQNHCGDIKNHIVVDLREYRKGSGMQPLPYSLIIVIFIATTLFFMITKFTITIISVVSRLST